MINILNEDDFDAKEFGKQPNRLGFQVTKDPKKRLLVTNLQKS